MKVIDLKKVFELKKELQELLKDKPELQAFQEQIAGTLQKMGNNKQNRMVALSQMMQDHVKLQMEAFRDITTILEKSFVPPPEEENKEEEEDSTVIKFPSKSA